jgi:CheY-like chemotaxis protein
MELEASSNSPKPVCRVLVVEDSEDNRVLIEHFLTRAGIQVDLAENGREGVAKATSRNYDLVVMDIQMPILDGHQATRELRLRGYKMPIVALTAHAFQEDRERAMANGFTEYLTKPINRATFLEVIVARLNLSIAH